MKITFRSPRLLIIVALSLCTQSLQAQQQHGLLREVWSLPGSGGTVADLTNHVNFPNRPTSTNLVVNFEAPTDAMDYYGQRLRGYVQAPLTGNYTFWIASDDNSTLFLSTDATPARRVPIAYVPGWTSSRAFTTYSTQQSAPVNLQAGKLYYVEALMAEGSGGDNLAVRWQLPNGVMEEPIPNNRLYIWGISFTPPLIATQPTNVTTSEGQPAAFAVTLSSVGEVYYQWTRDHLAITGATNATLVIPAVTLSDNGSQFSCVLSNYLGQTNSDSAVLTVSRDTIRPTVERVRNDGTNVVVVIFSEALQGASATKTSNYAFDQGVQITSAKLSEDRKTVRLGTSPLALGVTYTLTVNNIADRATLPNFILPDTRASFMAIDFLPSEIGHPTPPGNITVTTNGLVITAGGSDIGAFEDQFSFSYQRRTGDFDIQVQLSALDLTDPWAKAGLMVRDSLATNGAFALITATPSRHGCLFEYRPAAGEYAVLGGAHPASYPDTWLRLQRQGNQIRGYAGYDGENWQLVGTIDLALPAQAFFGLAVCSHNPDQTTTAVFRNLAPVDPARTTSVDPGVEPLGPSSRRTGLIISEIMYNPARNQAAESPSLEYVELFNTTPFKEDLSGYRLSGDIDFTFPQGTIMPPGTFLVAAKSPEAIRDHYGITNVMGPYTNSLTQVGNLRLRNAEGAIFLEVSYANRPPWPVAADGAGHSLVLARPSYGEGDPRAWDVSAVMGGSPGRADGYFASPLRHLRINEFLAHTDPPAVDFIELYNHSRQELDLSGVILTDDPATNKFVIPAHTKIGPGAVLAFTEAELTFALQAARETIYLLNPEHTHVLEAIRYEAQARGLSTGRFPDGADDFYPLESPTPGAPNSPRYISDIVINEIMYHPLSGQTDDEYVELYNQGARAVDLSQWRFTDGINFTFAGPTVLEPGAYLVVARNTTNLFAQYPQLHPGNTVGNFSGTLGNNSERLALARPEIQVTTNRQSVVITNIIYPVVDEVTYQGGGRWGEWSDGGGSSLELIDPRSNHRLAANWADSDESQKAPWTTIENTGNPAFGTGDMGNLQVIAFEKGEYLIDNVVVSAADNNNRIANPDFEGGLDSWYPQGSMVRSSLEEREGQQSARSLHIRSSGRGDNGANRIRAAFNGVLPYNQRLTIRAQVRWLKGWPEILLRLKGNYLEATGPLNVPANLGTPGARNSRAAPQAGPAIYGVQHWPVVPAAGQPVVVTARADDSRGRVSLRLFYRVDPNLTYALIAMTDDGSNGDAVAGDGRCSATIPGQPAGSLIAFCVEATSPSAPVSHFPEAAPLKECLVNFGEEQSVSSFGSYRLWITQNTRNTWESREVLSNEPLDGTFVYGNFRAVYNAGARYAGSPYHQGFYSPVGGNCHYSIDLPKDDRLLGTSSFNKIHQPGNGPGDDATLQREQTAYWMVRQLGLPWLYRRYVNFYVNGVRSGILMEDMQVPGADVLAEHYPNDQDGYLYKHMAWFEFDDSTSGYMSFNNNSWANLQAYTNAAGQYVRQRYRWNWNPRSLQHSGNDYDQVFALVRAANTPAAGPYVENLQAVADMDNWLRTFAIEHAVGNWDSFGNRNAWNMYAYKPLNDPWRLFIFDFNIVLGNSGSDGPTGDNLFQTSDSVISTMYANPTFQRKYWQALREIADGPMNSTNVDPIMDEKYAAFVADGLNVSAPDGVKNWIALRHTYLLQQLRYLDDPFSLISNGGENFSTDQNLVVLEGTAPLNVSLLKVAGLTLHPTWAMGTFGRPTVWRVQVPLRPGINYLTVIGCDALSNNISRAFDAIQVTYTGSAAPPQNQVVINEIMYHPPTAGAEYLELLNIATNQTFDLSRWRLDGLDFVFPDGAYIQPGQYLVVAQNASTFALTYGAGIPVVGEFAGKLANEGETIQLIKPGATAAGDVLIDEVTYRSTAPWPANANGLGASLQLIDPARDNNRVGNWAAGAGPGQCTPGAANAVLAEIPAFPNVRINEIQPQPIAGLITNSLGQAAPWLELYNSGSLPADLSGLFLANHYTNLEQWAFPAGAAVPPHGFLVVVLNDTAGFDGVSNGLTSPVVVEPVAGTVVLSRRQNGKMAVVDYLSYPSITPDRSYGSFPDGKIHDRMVFARPTPGGTNDPTPATIRVFINEWLASNTGSLVDPATQQGEDWFELYNAGAQDVDLSDYSLTDNLTNANRWSIPVGTRIPARGFLLVWADKYQSANGITDGALHADFKLNKDLDAIGLFAPNGLLVDAVAFTNQISDVSEGRWPDGQPEIFSLPGLTPGAPNAMPVTPFKLLGISIDQQTIQISWNSTPRQWYQVQCQENLQEAFWRDLQPPVQAVSNLTRFLCPAPAAPRQYYRIMRMTNP